MLAALSGPVDRLRNPATVVNPLEFFGPQVTFAQTSVDGYSAVGQTVPAAGIVFGGFQDPSLWGIPTSDIVTFTIPADAQPGTYLMAIKARREFNGEALNRGATVRIQVGSPAVTTHTSRTQCGSCHSASERSFGNTCTASPIAHRASAATRRSVSSSQRARYSCPPSTIARIATRAPCRSATRATRPRRPAPLAVCFRSPSR